MYIKSTLWGISLLFFINTSYGQIKNSEEKNVASFFNAKSNRIELTGGETSFKQRIGKWYGTFLGKGTSDTSSVKVTGLFYQIGITETKKFIDIDNFDFGENNGILAGLEFIHSFDKIYKNKDFRTHDLITFKGGLNGSYKRVKVLDTISGNINSAAPFKLNVNASLGYFWFKWKYKHLIAYPQLNVGYDIITYNEKELKAKFAKTDDAAINDGILIVNDSFDGVVGEYSNNAKVLDASFSFPWITEYNHKFIPNFMISPYASLQDYSYLDNTIYMLGTSITVLGKSFFSKEMNINDTNNSSYQDFKPPSFLTFGFDWGFKDGSKPSKPNFYLTGSFNIE